MTFSINELKDMCNNAFKRNSIYPLMEISKPDSKGTIEEQLNDLYIKAENAKREIQDEIVSEWISDINVRIKASKMFKKLKENKSMKQFENEYLNHF